VDAAAHLRVGSLEILGALAVFGVLTARFWPDAPAEVVPAVTVVLDVRDAVAGPPRELSLQLAAGGEPRILGRSSQAHIGLLDPEVSRRHAQIELFKGVVYLEDLDSSNGTFLNGKPVADEGIEVRPGDQIDVGNTRITVMGITPASWT